MRVWMNEVMSRGSSRCVGPAASDWAPLPTQNLVGRCDIGGQHDLRDAALPLTHQELALGTAIGVPTQRAEDRFDGVVAQPVSELGLIVDGADGRDRGGEHLPCGESVGGVLWRGPAELLLELLDELGVL